MMHQRSLWIVVRRCQGVSSDLWWRDLAHILEDQQWSVIKWNSRQYCIQKVISRGQSGMIYVRNQYCCIETSLWTYILPPRPFVVRALLQKQTRHTPDHHCRAESTYYLWDGSHQICFALRSEQWSMFSEHILQCFCTILAQGDANSFTISKVTYVLDDQQFKY